MLANHKGLRQYTETIAFFTVKHVCEAISGYFVLFAINCLAST